MAVVKFKGNEVRTAGEFPKVGEVAPDFCLVRKDLSEVGLGEYKGKVKVISIVPSLDTGVCAASTRRFNKEVEGMSGVVVLVVSADLPFAQKRFCEVEGLKNVEGLSSFRSGFGVDYGVRLEEGALKGLNTRGVLVLDGANKVIYSELVGELTQEPNYEAVLKHLK